MRRANARLPVPTAAAVLALCEKYREIRALRIEHLAGEVEDPRPRLRALSARFPGALRELDELPMELIDSRLALLDDVLAQAQPAPEWLALQLAYHGWMRAALQIKRIARGRDASAAEAVLAELAQHYRPDAHEPAVESFDCAAVVAILEPLEGRLNPWVYARVAEAAGVEPEAVRRALFLR